MEHVIAYTGRNNTIRNIVMRIKSCTDKETPRSLTDLTLERASSGDHGKSGSDMKDKTPNHTTRMPPPLGASCNFPACGCAAIVAGQRKHDARNAVPEDLKLRLWLQAIRVSCCGQITSLPNSL